MIYLVEMKELTVYNARSQLQVAEPGGAGPPLLNFELCLNESE